ncbi:MAG: hypothetical protein EPN33_06180 [Acidobacteria bacterium]|nr:MAG: hypothetical protein EPN33_06180 [Acidobacteriota bacterium]
MQFERCAVTRIDLHARRVRTEDGRERTYDTVMLATGIRTDPARVPGLAAANAEFGDYHSTVPQAMKIWQHLKHFRGGTIVIGQAGPICKCPPSPLVGIFLTEELLRRRGLRHKARLVYFTPYPRAYPAEPMNEIVEPILRERGIEVCTFFDLEQVDPANRTLHSLEAQRAPAGQGDCARSWRARPRNSMGGRTARSTWATARVRSSSAPTPRRW